MKIPIFTDEAAQQGGWHGIALSKAFAKRGHEAVFVELQDCVIDLTQSQPKINIPQLETLPKLAFVRGIAAGTLQQVITRLNILHILRIQGVRIYNDARAIERTVDKGMTSFLLKQHKIPTPATWVCESRHDAHALIQAQVSKGNQLVIKPLFGSQGQGVRLLNVKSSLPLPKDMFVDGVFYLQQLIDTGADNYDYRVFVVNGQVVSAMRRSGAGWLNNVAQGARCELVDDEEIFSLANQAAKAIDISYCGVDIIRDQDDQLLVLEVNSIPAWKALQAISDVDIAQVLADDLLSGL